MFSFIVSPFSINICDLIHDYLYNNMYKSKAEKAIWTYDDEYVVDMERGLYMHSKTMTPQQYTRYFRTNHIVTRPDLSTNWQK